MDGNGRDPAHVRAEHLLVRAEHLLVLAEQEIRLLREELVSIIHVCSSQPGSAHWIVRDQAAQELKRSSKRFSLPEDE